MNRIAAVIAAVAVLAAAAWLRLWHLDTQLVFDDEWHVLHKLLRDTPWGIFTTLGQADHSIPLTLLYAAGRAFPGLDEITFRLPPLIAGLALVAVLPRLLRGIASPGEAWLTTALAAVSPLLVQFSRQARPYAPVVLLTTVAMFAAHAWQRDRRTIHAVLYAACTVLAAWLHPLSLVFSGSALVWVFGRDLITGDRSAALRSLALGGICLAACAALLAPPLVNDFQAGVLKKAGHGALTLDSLIAAGHLLAGTAHTLVAAVLLALVVAGAPVLRRRAPELAGMVTLGTVLSVLAIVVLQPVWIQHGLVLARYLLPVLPFLLLAAALGLHTLTARAGRFAPPATAVCLVVAVYLPGPLPEIYRAPNAFTGHLAHQFDYRADHNAFRTHLDDTRTPAVYRRLAGLADRPTLIFAPWRFASHHNPAAMFQAVHGLPVRAGFMTGLCAGDLRGEYPPGTTGLDFDRFVPLVALVDGLPPGHVLVVHKRPMHPDFRPLPQVATCIARLRGSLGTPWHEDADTITWYRPE